jgi:signal peptidase I
MILDIKKLFTKGTTIGRYEYLKLTLGLIIFPMVLTQIAISIPPNNLLYNIFATIAIITIFACLTITYVATFKRLKNIFNNTIISVIALITFIFSGVIKLFYIIFNILLVLIPGKKKSDYFVSSKLFLVTFPLVILLFISLKILGINRWIPSEAMANTLQVNDRIIINIFDKDYNRGDIIIHNSSKKGVVYIKRIVALPGEKVEIKTLKNGAKYIFINDKQLDEPYVKNVYDYPECSSQMKCEPIIVPENDYYVLGDNRGKSFDSRYYGTINKNTITGKLSHIWFPLNRRQVFTTPEYSSNK